MRHCYSFKKKICITNLSIAAEAVMMAEKTAGDGFWARNLCHYAKPFYPKCKEFLELSSGVDETEKANFIPSWSLQKKTVSTLLVIKYIQSLAQRGN